MSKGASKGIWTVIFLVFVLVLPIFQFLNVTEIKTMKDVKKAGSLFSTSRYVINMDNPENLGTFSYEELVTKRSGRRRTSKTEKNIHSIYKVQLEDGYVYTFTDKTGESEDNYVLTTKKVSSFDGFFKTITTKPENLSDDDYVIRYSAGSIASIIFRMLCYTAFFFIFKKIICPIVLAIVNHFK